MTFFSEKNSIFTAKISDILVIDQVFRILPFFSQILCIFTMLNVVNDPFLTRKTPFFTLFILSRASDNTTSQNIGGDGCMGRPPPQTLGGPSPQSLSRSPPLRQLHQELLYLNRATQLFRPTFALLNDTKYSAGYQSTVGAPSLL